MNEHGILFTAPSVRAILAGTKTQTRRIVKPPEGYRIVGPNDGAIGDAAYRAGNPRLVIAKLNGLPSDTLTAPHGPVGRRLWVKETWQPIWATEDRPPSFKSAEGWAIGYPATDGVKEYHDENDGIVARCKPSIFMPRWASRITLEVTRVRLERVQSITEEDARAEGIGATCGPGGDCKCDSQKYAALWDEINAKPRRTRSGKVKPGQGDASWSANPPDNVIALKPRAPRAISASLLIQHRNGGARSCLQHSYLIDPKDPIVECAHCKQTFTAMDALEDIARSWTNRAYELKHMKDEIASKQSELAELKREVANLRAQKRRLESK